MPGLISSHFRPLRLVRRSEAPGASARTICAAPERGELLALLESFVNDEHGIGINVINRSGQLIASRSDENCGLFVSQAMSERLRRVFAGETRFFVPISELERLAQAPRATMRDPVTWIEAPVADDLDRAIYLCLAKSRADRPQSIGELMGVFDVYLSSHPWREAAAQEWWAQYRAEALADGAQGEGIQAATGIQTGLGSRR